MASRASPGRSAAPRWKLWSCGTLCPSFPTAWTTPSGRAGQLFPAGRSSGCALLLDEATSALDTQTEKEVQAALDKLLAGRSAVIVAHRLTTVQNAHYVYVLEQGHVLEEGAPKELLAKRGRYYEMCRLQGLAGEEAGT